MVFLVVQIRSGPKVLKPWYGCVINESCTLCDVFTEFSGGRLDGSLPIPAEYSGTAVEAFVGAKRTELTRVSCECTVGEAITALGQYVEYTVSVDMSMNVETSSNKADAILPAIQPLKYHTIQQEMLQYVTIVEAKINYKKKKKTFRSVCHV